MLSRKRRTREHVVGDLGVNHVEREVLLCGHVLERVKYDYGYDLILSSFDASGYVEPGFIGIQVKATERKPLATGRTIKVRIERSDLILWVNEQLPVILVVFCVAEKLAFYVDVQEYYRDAGINLFTIGRTVTVDIPRNHEFRADSITRIVNRKNTIVRGINHNANL